MSTEKHARIYYWFRSFTILLLIGFLLPSTSAFAQDQTPSSRKALAIQSNLTPINKELFSGSDIVSPDVMAGELSTNIIQDGSFEAYQYPEFQDPYWAQSDSAFGTPLCTYEDCDYYTVAHPYNGYSWAWFGWIGSAVFPMHTASLSQTVYLPQCSNVTLQFYFWIGAAASGSGTNDVFRAKVDGVTVFSANAAQKNTYNSYKLISVNVGSFANGANHTIEFSDVITTQAVTFNLDDVSLLTNCATITGHVWGTGGIALNYTDGSPKTATTQGDGLFSFTVPIGWNGTVTPSNPCFTFSPSDFSYYNVTSSMWNQDYTATFSPAVGCANVDVSIGGSHSGNFGLSPATSQHGIYNGVVNGPVKVVSMNEEKIVTSQRAVYGNSFNEMMGYPVDQFTTEYWFPWYDGIYMATWILVGNPSASQDAYVDIYIGGVKKNATPYDIKPGNNITPRFNGLVNGPVRVVSVTGAGTPSPLNIFASERSTFHSSFNEVMGVPFDQFTTEYWFPWYDNTYMKTWILVGNPSSTQHAYVDIYIHGIKKNVTPYDIPPSGNIQPKFDGLVNGPVQVVSVTGDGTPTPLNIFSSERTVSGGSFSEVMGMPLDQFTTDYWFPWVDQFGSNGMKTWILVGNPSSSQTAYVDIYIAGVKQGETRSIAPNGNITPTFTTTNGPVEVVSVTGDGTPTPIDIFTSERILYGKSFNEMMGYPANQLTTEYWFTWYDNIYMKTDLFVGKP